MKEISVEIEYNARSDRVLNKVEKFAILDWIFGEMNAEETREYGRVAMYPKSMKEALSTSPQAEKG